MQLWHQTEISLPPFHRGFHLITRSIIEAVPEIEKIETGLAHVFILHTSASLTLNENADPDVRVDMESHFNQLAPDNSPHFIHTLEGPDDMPAHIKSSLLGSSVSFPIYKGRPRLGTWQGIYLCEHRNHGGSRKLVITLNGQTHD